MAGVIDSFFARLGFEVDTKGIAAFEKHVAGARQFALGVVASAGAAAAAMGAFVNSVASNIDELGDFAELNQVSVATIQELGHAAQLNGASLDAVKSSVQGLNSVMGQALTGVGRGAKMFENFGFAAKNSDGSVKSFDNMLAEISDRMQGMNRIEAMAMASKLGIDNTLVPMLQSGAGAIAKLREEARAFGVTSEDDAKAAGAFMDAMDRLRFMAGALRNKLATGLMPMMTQLIDRFKGWYMANREIINQRLEAVFNAIATAISYVWKWVYSLVSGVIDAVEWLSKFKVVTYLATAALAAFIALKVGQFWHSLAAMALGAAKAMLTFSATALLVPMVIGAIILAIGLLIEDFMVWREGGLSVIGDLVAKFPALGAAIETISGYVTKIKEFWMAQWIKLKEPVGKLGESLMKLATVVLPILGDIFAFVFSVAGSIISALLPIVISVFTWIIDFITSAIVVVVKVFTWISDACLKIWQTVSEVFDWIANAVTKTTNVIQSTFSTAINYVLGLFADFLAWLAVSISGLIEVWSAFTALLSGAWDVFTSTLKSAAKSALDYVAGLFDAAKAKVMGYIDAVTAAIGKVGELLGMSGKSISLEAAAQGGNAMGDNSYGQSPLEAAIAGSSGMPPSLPSSGVLGRAAQGGNSTANTTTTDTTNITGTVVNINSNDPAKAGESVREVFQNQIKRSVRNGQSAKQL